MMLVNRRRLKVSRRDAFLALFGVAYILIGYSFLNIAPVYKPLIHAQLRAATDLAGIEVYGWAWITSGGVAIVGAIWRRFDTIGFAVATFMPLLWSLAYWAAVVQDQVPRAWVSGVIYLVLGGAVSLGSGMQDPRRRDMARKR